MADNVDYNGLKHLIKERTSNIKTNPVTIPGQASPSDAWTQLENELFSILRQQHERVSLFSKSKCGEIQRRLDQVERQLTRLAHELPLGAQYSLPVHHTRKYARLVQDTESISEDIQSLSQFANTQRLAFQKILKKYRRWTGSANLQLRMDNEILNQDTSFLWPDLSLFLERLSKFTLTLRSMALPKRRDQAGNGTVRDQTSTTPQQHSIFKLNEAAVKRSSLTFDAKLLSIPLGHAAGRATYWIHPENISEVEVLLLRHMRYRASKEQGSPISHRRMHSAMFDNLQRYVQEQGATTVAQLEDVEGSFASKVALSILWAEEADAVAIASDLSPVKAKTVVHRRTSRVRRTELPSCFGQDTFDNGNFSREGSTEVRDFLAQHRDVKPLAEIHSTRDQFVGINNSKDVGVWAVLEQGITMSPLDITTIGAESQPSTDSDYSIENPEGQTFPYAVLQIRWEFSRVPEIVRALDNSHLTERVRGFTLETEAIYAICSPQGMREPLWQPLLSRDIRKVPPVKPKRRRRNGSSSAGESVPPSSARSSSGGPYDSIFSSTKGQSSTTSAMTSAPNTTEPNSPDSSRFAFGEQKPPKPKKHVRLPPPLRPVTIDRYWNEFDDGSEVGDDTSYAIYVNPEEPSDFPGTKTVSRAFSALYKRLRTVKRHIISWIPSSSPGSKEREREPLLASHRAVPDLEDSSDSDAKVRASGKSLRRNGGLRAGSSHRSGSSVRHRKLRDSRETMIFGTYVTAFLFSYVMLTMSAILKWTGRHKARFEVDTGVTIGVTIAMFCGIGGVGLMLSRRDRLSSLHRVAVVLAFCIVCVGGGYLLALVGNTN